MMEILKSCPFEEPVGKYEIEQSEPMTKKEYVEMLYQRTEYLKSEIAEFENCKGELEQSKLWAIKEQVSCIFGLIDVCDKELFPDTIRCEKTEQEYIQTCNMEQLAEFLHGIVIRAVQATWDGKKPDYPAYLYDWKMWLKQPHKPIS